MCQECEQDAERMRPVVDLVVQAETVNRRMFERHTQGQHAVRLANTLLECHSDNQGYLNERGVQDMALEYALVVHRLIALQELSGLTG
jgi:hypothetical protein